MADQEQLYDDSNIGKVVDRILEQEMRESYLDYAMSVIVSRALPDVRDGLKPVHRRVLYAMNEMGLRHTVKFRKSAAVVGEVMSKYHPHGDMAIYDTLVRLAQDFAMRYRLVQGQGNFGCFTKDTKIKLTDGRDLSFEDLVKEYKKGKINYTYTVNNLGLISIAEIKNPRLTIKQAELVKVTLDNGEEIRCTPNHLFMLKEGKYKEAQLLISGESLMPLYQEINKNHKVVKVEKLSYSEDVYDLTIDHSHNFCLAAGVFVHNSVDGDNAAAPRYTEARMTSLAEELLMDIDKDTVEFMDNYDGTRKEPKVLPAKVPQLLLNGTMGIAVGMATSIPPHNLGELTDAIIALIDNPETTIEELMVHMPGPDFPTGGVIYNPEEIKEAYMTGKGRVIMRAVAEIEDSKRGYRIIISELPYQVNKAELVAKIAELVKTKKIVGISDLRDESDKDGVRVVIELKSDSYPKKVLNQLFKLTPMQSSFHVNTLALVNGLQPKVLNLKAVLEYFVAHRVEVVTNRTKFELLKAQERAHILEGLKIALDNLDAVIATIRKSDTKEEAHTNLTKKFNLSDVQASAILEMRLSALAGLERKKVEDEYKEKQVLIKELKTILADPKRILAIIKTESLDIKAKYGDKRRTKIMGQTLGKFNEKDLVPNEEVVITLTKSGYIKRQPSASYRSQHRGGKGIIGMTTKDEDQIDIIQATKNHDDILFFTNRGRVFRQKVYEVPQSSRIAKGTAIVNVIQLAPEEVVTSILTMPSYKPGDNFVMITHQGVIKKTMADKYANIRASGLIAIKLDVGDELRWVKKSHKGDTVVIITREGQSIHFPETDARLLGRSTRGVRGIKLRSQDTVISADVAHPDLEYACLVLAEKGLGKRTNLNQYTLQRRGGVGVKTMHLTERTGKIIAGELVEKGLKADLIITSKQGQVIRTPLNTVPMLGRVTQGVTLMRLKGGDKTANFSIIVKDDTVEGEDAGAELDTTESKQPKLPGAVIDASDKKVAPDKSSKTFIKRAISVSGLKERTSKLAKKSKGFVKKSITPLAKASTSTSRLSKKRKK